MVPPDLSAASFSTRVVSVVLRPVVAVAAVSSRPPKVNLSVRVIVIQHRGVQLPVELDGGVEPFQLRRVEIAYPYRLDRVGVLQLV